MMKYILSLLLIASAAIAQPYPPRVPGPVVISQPGNGTGSSGVDSNAVVAIVTNVLANYNLGGGVVSNAWALTVSTNVVYTNATDYFLVLSANFGINNPVNNTNAVEFWCDYNTNGTLSFINDHWLNNNNAYMESRFAMTVVVPPRVGYEFVAAIDSGGSIYALTDASYAVYLGVGGSGGGGTGDVTESGLAAGDYPIDGTAITGVLTNNTTGNAATANITTNIWTPLNNVTFNGQGTIDGTSSNNFIHGFGGGNITTASRWCFILGANPGGNYIDNSIVSGVLAGNDVNIYNSQYSIVSGGQHIAMGGSSSGAGGYDGHNFIGGGNNVYLGDEFTTDAFFANANIGGEQVYWLNSSSNTVSLGGGYHTLDSARNGAIISGASNSISGIGPMAIGWQLTNTQNHEVMLGKLGTELRIYTNGNTTLGSLIASGSLTHNGNYTNGGNTFVYNATAYTNKISGSADLIESRYGAGVLSFWDMDEFDGGAILEIEGGTARAVRLPAITSAAALATDSNGKIQAATTTGTGALVSSTNPVLNGITNQTSPLWFSPATSWNGGNPQIKLGTAFGIYTSGTTMWLGGGSSVGILDSRLIIGAIGDLSLERAAAGVLRTGSIIVTNSITATNGSVYPQLSAIPTNSVDVSSNIVNLINLAGTGPAFINTNSLVGKFDTNKIVLERNGVAAVNQASISTMFINSNIPPAAPISAGQMYMWNSNGVRAYMVIDGGTGAWTATNALW